MNWSHGLGSWAGPMGWTDRLRFANMLIAKALIRLYVQIRAFAFREYILLHDEQGGT